MSVENLYGYNLSLIIRYLELITGDGHTAQFINYHFSEQLFPRIGINEARTKM